MQVEGWVDVVVADGGDGGVLLFDLFVEAAERRRWLRNADCLGFPVRRCCLSDHLSKCVVCSPKLHE